MRHLKLLYFFLIYTVLGSSLAYAYAPRNGGIDDSLRPSSSLQSTIQIDLNAINNPSTQTSILGTAKETVVQGYEWFLETAADMKACTDNGGEWMGVNGCLENKPTCPAGEYWSGGRAGGYCKSQCGANQHWVDGHKTSRGCYCDVGFRLDTDTGGCIASDPSAEEETDCADMGRGSSSGAGCEPEVSMSFSECVLRDFADPLCRQHEEERQKAIAVQIAALEANCTATARQAGTSCGNHNTKAAETQAQAINSGNAGSAADRVCGLASSGPTSQGVLNDHRSRCRGIKSSCENTCTTPTEFYGQSISGANAAGSCSTNTDPHLQKMSNLISVLAGRISEFKAACQALKNPREPREPGDTTTTTVVTTTGDNDSDEDDKDDKDKKDKDGKKSELAESKQPSALDALGSLASGLGGDSSGGGEFTESFGDTAAVQSGFNSINSSFKSGSSSADGVYRKKRNNLNLGANAASGGDNLRGLPDDPRQNARPGAVNPNNNTNLNGQGNVGARGRGGNAQFAALASNNGGPTGRRRPGNARTAKGRNLLHGYKNVRPTDGGGALSIKPSDMKRYGRSVMKSKLNAARKKYGLKVPLMFKNGKFVRDFLAMKESKGFKSRQAAMESYWRGNSGRKARIGDHECVSKNECHTNVKANIFKLMNFRLQKSFHDVKIDI